MALALVWARRGAARILRRDRSAKVGGTPDGANHPGGRYRRRISGGALPRLPARWRKARAEAFYPTSCGRCRPGLGAWLDGCNVVGGELSRQLDRAFIDCGQRALDAGGLVLIMAFSVRSGCDDGRQATCLLYFPSSLSPHDARQRNCLPCANGGSAGTMAAIFAFHRHSCGPRFIPGGSMTASDCGLPLCQWLTMVGPQQTADARDCLAVHRGDSEHESVHRNGL